MKLLSFHKIGEAKNNTSRIWLESNRLHQGGFSPQTPYHVIPSQRKITLQINPTGKRQVSHRKQAGTLYPIIDICSKLVKETFGSTKSIKAKMSQGKIEISPSLRAFLIKKGQGIQPPFQTLELFAGGRTLADAFKNNPLFKTIAGMEIEPKFANVWAAKNPEALLIQSDIRLIHPSEIPRFDVLVAGIPCTSHSTLGRAKKSLKSKPEEGDTGDLFLHTLQLVSHHLPACCVFENVPSFSTSLAGSLIKTTLSHLGYHTQESILEPHSQWAEPSDRRRWCLIATLHPEFNLQIPNIPFFSTLKEFLDPEDPLKDEADANRIAKTIRGLEAHNARHATLGHGFAMSLIERNSTKSPTIPKSYHKINTGPFVRTPFGPRLLKLHKVEKIMGANAGTQAYATGIQILGQGVQTKIWENIFSQIGEFLKNPGKYTKTQEEPNQLSLEIW